MIFVDGNWLSRYSVALPIGYAIQCRVVRAWTFPRLFTKIGSQEFVWKYSSLVLVCHTQPNPYSFIYIDPSVIKCGTVFSFLFFINSHFPQCKDRLSQDTKNDTADFDGPIFRDKGTLSFLGEIFITWMNHAVIAFSLLVDHRKSRTHFAGWLIQK